MNENHELKERCTGDVHPARPKPLTTSSEGQAPHGRGLSKPPPLHLSQPRLSVKEVRVREKW